MNDLNTSNHFDLVVVGAGSGGFGAALAAARMGASVLLIEKSDSLGGNATRGGVNNWEPGVGGTGIPFELYLRLKALPQAVGIYTYHRHIKWTPPGPNAVVPGAELLIDPALGYLDSLRRFGAKKFEDSEPFIREHWHGVPFEPDACAAEMERMLLETRNCTIWKTTGFEEVETDGRRIVSLRLSNGEVVTGSMFVDATASIFLAAAAGCATTLGQEARALYHEPSAPLAPTDRLNGCTLIYRVSRRNKPQPAIDPLPTGIPEDCWWDQDFPRAVFTQYPNGDFNVNALPVMSGREAHELGYARAYAECQRRIYAHWRYVQKVFPEYQAFEISWIAPGLGVREGPRLLGRRVLTEHDLQAGISRQDEPDIIAIADHARDTHGADTGRAGCGELAEPYGIPFRCLLPVEYDNLAVACRGLSVSSVAASSCRLSRTIMQFGQAVGVAAGIAKARGSDNFSEVPAGELRDILSAQNVELSWPRPQAIVDHIRGLDGR